MVEENASGNLTPQYYYTPANTDVDLFGIDPYPVQTNVPNNYYDIIPLAVQLAELIGIPQQDLVPTYQAFGGASYPPTSCPPPRRNRRFSTRRHRARPGSSSPTGLRRPQCRQLDSAVVCCDPVRERRDDLKLCQGRLAEFRVRKFHHAIGRE